MSTTTTARKAIRRPASTPRMAKPRLLAYMPRRIAETCGCGHYYSSSCGINHSSSDSGCGHYYSSSCGQNHSSR